MFRAIGPVIAVLALVYGFYLMVLFFQCVDSVREHGFRETWRRFMKKDKQ